MTDRATRLKNMLEEMLGGKSRRQLARDLKISYASLIAYLNGDQFPEAENQDKIAQAYAGWTRKELEAYLDGRPVERSQSTGQLKQEIRAIDNLDDAEEIVKVAVAQLTKLARQQSS